MATSRPTFLQAFVITMCGIAIAFFGCLGLLSGLSRSGGSALATIGGIVFVAGLAVFAGGGLLLIFIAIRAIARRWTRTDRSPDSMPPPADRQSPE